MMKKERRLEEKKESGQLHDSELLLSFLFCWLKSNWSTFTPTLLRKSKQVFYYKMRAVLYSTSNTRFLNTHLPSNSQMPWCHHGKYFLTVQSNVHQISTFFLVSGRGAATKSCFTHSLQAWAEYGEKGRYGRTSMVSFLILATIIQESCRQWSRHLHCYYLMAGFKPSIRNLKYVSLTAVDIFCRKLVNTALLTRQKIANMTYPTEGTIQHFLGFGMAQFIQKNQSL